MLPVLIAALLDMKNTSDQSGRHIKLQAKNRLWSAPNYFLLPEYREQIFNHSCVTEFSVR